MVAMGDPCVLPRGCQSLWGRAWLGAIGVDAGVRELALISAISSFALELAWIYEADFFAIFFATAAAIAIVESSSMISMNGLDVPR
jgi:hypothetical protein